MISKWSILLAAALLLLVSCKPTEKTVETDSKVASDNKIYGQQLILEPGVEFPKLKGGLKRVQRKLEYPPEAQKNRIQGRVVVSFVVNKKGKAQDLQVDKGLGYGCDRAAIEAVQKASFEPATKNGKPVNFKFALPIAFSLN
jgi:TonB family protein